MRDDWNYEYSLIKRCSLEISELEMGGFVKQHETSGQEKYSGA